MSSKYSKLAGEICAAIDYRFRNYILKQGIELDAYKDGYDFEGGQKYADLIESFLDSFLTGGISAWRVNMEWDRKAGSSWLVAMRTVGNDGEFSVVERRILSSPLSEEEIDHFVLDVFKLLERSNELSDDDIKRLIEEGKRLSANK